MHTAPSSDGIMPPRPPPSCVPPKATAASAMSVYWANDAVCVDCTSAVSAIPATDANAPPRAYAMIRVAVTLMPALNAVASLPPTEYRLRWYAVRDSTNQITSGIAIRISAPGIGPTLSAKSAVQLPAAGLLGDGAIFWTTPASTKTVHSVAITG